MNFSSTAVSDPLARITGMSVADFAAHHWGSQPRLSRAAQLRSESFEALLSLAAVDELVSRRGLRTPFVRMSRNGEILPARRFTRGGGAGAEIADQIADDKVLAEFAAGATLVLQGLHRIWAPVQEFATALTLQLGHPVQVNAYITPPQSTGFAAHYDVHDVFVLQFAGCKRWRIHEPVIPSPGRDQSWESCKPAVAARAAQSPLIDAVLEPGDALYLPRGYLHAATALGEVSGHLTVGVQPVTRQTLVAEAFATLAGDVALRRSLPLGVDLSDPDVLSAEWKSTVAALHAAIDALDSDTMARGVRQHLGATTRPAPLAPLVQFGAAEALAPASRVRLRTGLRVTLRLEAQELVVQLPDKELRMPADLADAVRFATSGSDVCAAGLPGIQAPDGLTLVRRLLREGVVVPV